MVEQDITIHQGWLELYSDSSSGAWGKLSGKKQWKRRFIVFNQSASNEDECYLLSYEKEEAWRVAIPKRKLSLYPRYKVCKLNDFKGREKVLEVNNEQEKWYFASDKMKLINLWACQIQMQTKLSRSISGRIFSVVGASVKDMHNIGAAQQRCLLHFTKWGITLALQQSRAILAMWPIKTIRNYEDSGHSEFTIEAGRRAPMGEGVYKFETNAGQDREMFNVVDAFVAALLDEKARIAGASKQTTDDDILKIYDQLYKTAIGENQPHPQPPQPMNQRPKFHNQDMHDTPGYSHIGMNSATLSTKTSADNMSHVPMYKPPDYDNLYGEGVDFSRVQLDDEKKHSTGSYGDYSPRDLSFTEQNYDKLGGRNPSWGGSSDGGKGEYDHINSNTIGRKVDNTYDQIDRTGTSFKKKQGSWGTAGYPLRDEPSVPCLDDYDHSFKGRSPIQQTPENEKGFIFRNSIYSPLDSSSRKNSSASTIQGIGSRHDSTASEGGRPMGASAQGMDIRHDSTASESGRHFRRGISIKERSHQDIADHFMYQVPSSLNSTTDQETSFQQEEVYQNTQGTTPDETYSNTSSSQNTNSERSTTA